VKGRRGNLGVSTSSFSMLCTYSPYLPAVGIAILVEIGVAEGVVVVQTKITTKQKRCKTEAIPRNLFFFS
jgi:hypothetical protein